MDLLTANEYSAREYIGCVSDSDTRGILNRETGDSLKPLPAWHHYTASCICAQLHNECDLASCPEQTNEELQPSAREEGLQKLDLLSGVSLQQLQDTSGAGCWFCSIIYNGMEDALRKMSVDVLQVDRRDQLVVRAEKPRAERMGRLFFCISLIFPGEEVDDTPQYEFYKPESLDESHVCACFRTAPEIPISTALPESFIFAKRQMAKCIKSVDGRHVNCETGEVTLPTRVLEIRDLNGRYSVRLLVTNGLKGKYFALSHCWGTKMHTTTTPMNLGERQEGIPWGCLSRTFRDAIHITYRFGFHFLWIDALCIIQGDSVDWQQESSRMHKVYQNCALMISADRARDGDEGCFSNGLSNSWLTKSQYHKANIAVRQIKTHSGIMRTTRTEKFSKLAPLARRAWAFQERTLATRILHYAVDELIWECGGMYNCQCGDIEHGIGLASPRKFLFRDCPLGRLVNFIWQGLVADYTERLLTIPEDRLPGFSGLATSFEETWNRLIENHRGSIASENGAAHVPDSTGSRTTSLIYGESKEDISIPKGLGRYVAGLWSNYLEIGLKWTRPFPNPPLLPKPAQYIAPSWSWASINSAVQFFEMRAKMRKISIIGASCTPAGLNPAGAVKEGHLIISGPVVTLTLSCSQHSSKSKSSRRYYAIYDYIGRDLSECYMPDYLLRGDEFHFATGVGLTVYGLVMSPDFTMVLKSPSPGVYERIGSLTFLPSIVLQKYDPSIEWSRDAVGMTLNII